MQVTKDAWILARLAASGDASLRAVRRVRCVSLHGARSTSHHYRVELDPAPLDSPRLFLKCYDAARPDVDVLREAATLTWLEAQRFGDASLRTPRVVAVDPDRRALLLTFHAGESLVRRLNRAFALARLSVSAAGGAIAVARRLGRTIAAFQALPPPPHLPVATAQSAVDRYAQDMERRVLRLEGAGIDTARLQSAWENALRLLAAVPMRPQHSDFGPWNVLVGTDGSLTLFDFHNFTAGHPAYDLAYMHLALEGTRRLRLTSGATVERAQHALIEGYRESGGAVEVDELRAFRIMHVAYFAYPLVSRRRSARLLAYGAHEGRSFALRWVDEVIAG